MPYLLRTNWWLHVLRGLLSVAFGLLALLWPRLTIDVLVILFGVYALLEGVLATGAAVARHGRRCGWLLLLEGLAGIAVGLIAVVRPGLMAVVLLAFIAVWAIFTGVLEIAAAVVLRRVITGEWALGLAGALSIVFGVLLIAQPGAGVLAVIWLSGAYALVFGALLVWLGIRARSRGGIRAPPVNGARQPRKGFAHEGCAVVVQGRDKLAGMITC